MKRMRLWLIGGALLGAGALALAEDVTVDRDTVDIRSGKGSMFPSVAQVHKGDTLTVVSHEGKWLKVSTNGKEGWVFEDVLSTRNSSALGDAVHGLSGGSNASDS